MPTNDLNSAKPDLICFFFFIAQRHFIQRDQINHPSGDHRIFYWNHLANNNLTCFDSTGATSIIQWNEQTTVLSLYASLINARRLFAFQRYNAHCDP